MPSAEMRTCCTVGGRRGARARNPALAQEVVQTQPQPVGRHQSRRLRIVLLPRLGRRPPTPFNRCRLMKARRDGRRPELPLPPPPPVEYPGWARRDIRDVGQLNPASSGSDPTLSVTPVGLSVDADAPDGYADRFPLGAYRPANALLAKVTAPRDVHPVDCQWSARGCCFVWRGGCGAHADRRCRHRPLHAEDAAAVQSVTGRAAILRPCARSRPIGKYEPNIRALVWPCARPSRGAGDRFRADRRCPPPRADWRDRPSACAKGRGCRRLAAPRPSEWEPVDNLTAWRFGLSTATGMAPLTACSIRPPQLRFPGSLAALTAEQRLNSAFVAAGLGVFSSVSLIDLYSAIQILHGCQRPAADRRLAGAPGLRRRGCRNASRRSGDCWRSARVAFLQRKAPARWPPARRPWSRRTPSSARRAGADFGDACRGYDEAAASGSASSASADDDAWTAAGRCWRLALRILPMSGRAASTPSSAGTIVSPNRIRSALLVGGLAGLGRIDTDTANSSTAATAWD